MWLVTCHPVPKVSIQSLKTEYYQHSYQSFHFMVDSFLHFILYVNYVVWKCCTTLLSPSLVRESCFIRDTSAKKNISWWSKVAFWKGHPPDFQRGLTVFVKTRAFDTDGQQDVFWMHISHLVWFSFLPVIFSVKALVCHKYIFFHRK